MNDAVKQRAILALRMIEMNKDGPAKEAAKRVCRADMLAALTAAALAAGCSQLSDPYAVAGNCPVPDHFWTSEPVYQRMERDTGERFARAPGGHYVLVGRNGDYDCARVLKIAGRK